MGKTSSYKRWIELETRLYGLRQGANCGKSSMVAFLRALTDYWSHTDLIFYLPKSGAIITRTDHERRSFGDIISYYRDVTPSLYD